MAVLATARGPAWLLIAAAAIPFLLMFAIRPVRSAPVFEDEQHHQLESYGDDTGCYYNYQHYGEGDRIITNEPCLNCTCHNRMLMCYLRVCPFTKAIGQDCTVEKKADQCCPVITCPEVPVQLLAHPTPSTTARPQSSTAVGHRDTYGCTIDAEFYADGAQIPSEQNKPCELCYCIRNHTACVMQECTLNVEGCKPIYQEGVCCPVRYECDYPEDGALLEDAGTGGGLVLTTTTTMSPNLGCRYNDDEYADGALIHMDDKPCEHCYCMRGDIVCAVQECGTPLEKEGHNCTALPPQPGKCCPEMYQCDTGIEYVTDASFRMNRKQYGNTYYDSLIEPTNAGPTDDAPTPNEESDKEATGEEHKPISDQEEHVSDDIISEPETIQESGEDKPVSAGVALDAGEDENVTNVITTDKPNEHVPISQDDTHYDEEEQAPEIEDIESVTEVKQEVSSTADGLVEEITPQVLLENEQSSDETPEHDSGEHETIEENSTATPLEISSDDKPIEETTEKPFEASNNEKPEIIVDEKPDEITTDESPVGVTADDSTVEVSADEKPLEVSADEKPLEVSADEKPSEVSADEKPSEVSADEKPLEVSADEKPLEVSADEKPSEVSADEKPLEVSADEKPLEVSADEKPSEVSADEKPLEVSADEKPLEVTADNKPVDPNTDDKPTEFHTEKPVEINTDDKPLEVTVDGTPEEINTNDEPVVENVNHKPEGNNEAEKPLEVTLDDKPVEVAENNKPEEVNADNIPMEVTTDDKPVEITAEDKPTEVNISDKPVEVITGDKTEEVTTEDKPVEDTADDIPLEITTEHNPEEVTDELKPEEVTNDQKPDVEINEHKPEEVIDELKPEEMNTVDKPEDVPVDNKPIDDSSENKPHEDVTADEKPVDVVAHDKPEEIVNDNKPEEIANEIKPEEIANENKPEDHGSDNKPIVDGADHNLVEVVNDAKPEEVLDDENPIETGEEHTAVEPDISGDNVDNKPIEEIAGNKPDITETQTETISVPETDVNEEKQPENEIEMMHEVQEPAPKPEADNQVVENMTVNETEEIQTPTSNIDNTNTDSSTNSEEQKPSIQDDTNEVANKPQEIPEHDGTVETAPEFIQQAVEAETESNDESDSDKEIISTTQPESYKPETPIHDIVIENKPQDEQANPESSEDANSTEQLNENNKEQYPQNTLTESMEDKTDAPEQTTQAQNTDENVHDNVNTGDESIVHDAVNEEVHESATDNINLEKETESQYEGINTESSVFQNENKPQISDVTQDSIQNENSEQANDQSNTEETTNTNSEPTVELHDAEVHDEIEQLSEEIQDNSPLDQQPTTEETPEMNNLQQETNSGEDKEKPEEANSNNSENIPEKEESDVQTTENTLHDSVAESEPLESVSPVGDSTDTSDKDNENSNDDVLTQTTGEVNSDDDNVKPTETLPIAEDIVHVTESNNENIVDSENTTVPDKEENVQTQETGVANDNQEPNHDEIHEGIQHDDESETEILQSDIEVPEGSESSEKPSTGINVDTTDMPIETTDSSYSENVENDSSVNDILPVTSGNDIAESQGITTAATIENDDEKPDESAVHDDEKPGESDVHDNTQEMSFDHKPDTPENDDTDEQTSTDKTSEQHDAQEEVSKPTQVDETENIEEVISQTTEYQVVTEETNNDSNSVGSPTVSSDGNISEQHDSQVPNKHEDDILSVVEQVTSEPMPMESDSLTHDFAETPVAETLNDNQSTSSSEENINEHENLDQTMGGGVPLDAGDLENVSEESKDPSEITTESNVENITEPTKENETSSEDNEHPAEVFVHDEKPIWTDESSSSDTSAANNENKPEVESTSEQTVLPEVQNTDSEPVNKEPITQITTDNNFEDKPKEPEVENDNIENVIHNDTPSISEVHISESHPAMQDAEESNPEHFNEGVQPDHQPENVSDSQTHDNVPVPENTNTESPNDNILEETTSISNENTMEEQNVSSPTEDVKHPENVPTSDSSESSSEEVTEAGDEDVTQISTSNETTDMPAATIHPAEGTCTVNGEEYPSGSNIPVANRCQESCVCKNSIVHCTLQPCPPPPSNNPDCMPIYRDGSCCPIYTCAQENVHTEDQVLGENIKEQEQVQHTHDDAAQENDNENKPELSTTGAYSDMDKENNNEAQIEITTMASLTQSDHEITTSDEKIPIETQDEHVLTDTTDMPVNDNEEKETENVTEHETTDEQVTISSIENNNELSNNLPHLPENVSPLNDEKPTDTMTNNEPNEVNNEQGTENDQTSIDVTDKPLVAANTDKTSNADEPFTTAPSTDMDQPEVPSLEIEDIHHEEPVYDENTLPGQGSHPAQMPTFSENVHPAQDEIESSELITEINNEDDVTEQTIPELSTSDQISGHIPIENSEVQPESPENKPETHEIEDVETSQASEAPVTEGNSQNSNADSLPTPEYIPPIQMTVEAVEQDTSENNFGSQQDQQESSTEIGESEGQEQSTDNISGIENNENENAPVTETMLQEISEVTKLPIPSDSSIVNSEEHQQDPLEDNAPVKDSIDTQAPSEVNPGQQEIGQIEEGNEPTEFKPENLPSTNKPVKPVDHTTDQENQNNESTESSSESIIENETPVTAKPMQDKEKPVDDTKHPALENATENIVEIAMDETSGSQEATTVNIATLSDETIQTEDENVLGQVDMDSANENNEPVNASTSAQESSSESSNSNNENKPLGDENEASVVTEQTTDKNENINEDHSTENTYGNENSSEESNEESIKEPAAESIANDGTLDVGEPTESSVEPEKDTVSEHHGAVETTDMPPEVTSTDKHEMNKPGEETLGTSEAPTDIETTHDTKVPASDEVPLVDSVGNADSGVPLNAGDDSDDSVGSPASAENVEDEKPIQQAPEVEHKPGSMPHYPDPVIPDIDEDEEGIFGGFPGQAPEPGTDFMPPMPSYEDEEHQPAFGPGTCRYGGKVYVSAQQIPRDDPCDFCFCFRSDIICLQQSCPPPIKGCHEEAIDGFCCPRYECPVPMGLVNATTTTTTTTTMPPDLISSYVYGRKGSTGCIVQGQIYNIGEEISTASGPCLECRCGGDSKMKCEPKACSPQPLLRKMIEAVSLRR